MVGAGENFIRQPFLYTGFWYGSLGAMLALVFLSIAVFYLQHPVEVLLESYGNRFEIQGLSVIQAMLVLMTGGMLGFLGAWVSVQRYLRQLRSSGRLVRT